ncbi:hypothetical protein HNV11_01915 [Spirosoma taeanense]|uniref:Uncharacterized protein n=1 Tax=Spirosoma taeanense TaxID=2735870 RepID=A0A6M5Y4U1_9BACT|nr:hypothetical protein [Spirosoma taeanense]QJW88221.1 hypothetical protein HNV11_01915 [Spirosoma taeanense]
MKAINSIVILFFSVLTLNSCTPKMTFTTSSIIPAASGDVEVKKDKNNNYIVNVSVRNLAEPQKLNPPKSTYLVWMESDNSSAKKLGQLAPYSKSLKADLSATSITKPTQVFITAENDAEVTYPRGETVLTTRK